MADTKISALSAKAAPEAGDYTVIVDNDDGGNKKIDLSTVPFAVHVVHGTIADAATIYPSSDGTGTGTKVQFFTVTGCAQATAFATPPGSWSDGDKLTIRIYSAAQQTLDFTTATVYRFGDVAAPTATTAGKTMYVGFIYNSVATKWDAVGSVGGL